jgi:hypothetical protein
MIDIDLLIHEIEKEECLWKTNNSNYMDKNAKQKAWFNVASMVFNNWDTSSEKEKKACSKFF